jgi:hypothetical protein
MTKRPLLALTLALTACSIAPGTAAAKGLGLAGASGGVAVPGSPYRYVAISPGYPDKLTPHALTVVVRIDRRDGSVDRWWYLRGFYYVPAVAYDGTGGGLSGDGRTLVLKRFSTAPSPPTTRLAILRTDPYLRHPLRPGQHRPPHAIGHVTLDGNFSFDAISPDGSTVYLTHYRPYDRASDDFEQRALDTRSGELSPRPVVVPNLDPDGAARIVRRLGPEVTIWFHQHYAPQPLVRAWGQSAPAARRFARLARLPFKLLRWPAGAAPNWQNHRFPGTSSFAVELPRGSLPSELGARLDRAVVSLGREVSED